MNRRMFLQSLSALASSALVPTWFCLPSVKRPIDLMPFCRTEPIRFRGKNLHVASPFVQVDDFEETPFTFATDGKVAVRVDADLTLPGLPDKQLPPVANLQWWPDDEQKNGHWLPWPAKYHQLANDSDCPQCDGFGVFPKLGECGLGECGACHGLGWFEIGDYGSFLSHEKKCSACRGSGWAGPVCSHCDGHAIGVFPAIQAVKSCDHVVYIDQKYDTKIRRLPNVRYRFLDGDDKSPIQFAFDGGYGLLMPVARRDAEQRMKDIAK